MFDSKFSGQHCFGVVTISKHHKTICVISSAISGTMIERQCGTLQLSPTLILFYQSSKVAIVNAGVAAVIVAAAHLDSVVSSRRHTCSDPHRSVVSAQALSK
jgi:hypothetical protein